ncbi:Retrovirus-related Pol polyprotein from transposon RE2 [Araneus ventricosus]|uniref:Retrovirus-related Pol polyprotein from transposon RE2 n=1 Tax=Araneus ventricosus TaxID=182803 RepID=A0A4Y2NNV0_ARAVE|nr:Retrovirus-related Pol polyprotein from transposon RE2 [Araneus ventricosus]
MHDRNVWTSVDPPDKSKILYCRWVYTVKTNQTDGSKTFKATLVASGFNQTAGVDYSDVFSPVVDFSVIRFMFILFVSILCWNHVQLDIRAAYLYGNLSETIYMHQPPGFVNKGEENKVYLLHKSIYGLKQSGCKWNEELDSTLNSISFPKLNWCNGVYSLKGKCFLLVYVDDLLTFGRTIEILNETIKLLKDKFHVKVLGNVKYLLGVNFDTIEGDLSLHQKTYIDRIERKFKGIPRSYVNLPVKTGISLHSKINPSEISENYLMKKFPYRSLIGCLSFIAERSPPDISFAVNVMAQFSNNYNYQHWLYVVDILNYVFNTKEYKINLRVFEELSLKSYSDASWGCELTDRYSTSGFIVCLANVPFMWKSRKQKTIALSSIESEFIAITDSVKELIWFSNILNELKVVTDVKPVHYCDNMPAIYFCKNNFESSNILKIS